MILNIVVLTRYFDNAYNVDTGMLFYYTLFQVCMWWLLHTAAIFWGIRFPFHTSRFRASHRIRYVHCTTVVVGGLIIPIIPLIITIVINAAKESRSGVDQIGKLGFGITNFPSWQCLGNDRDVAYYALLLPLNMVMIAGIAVMVVLIWTIIEVSCKCMYPFFSVIFYLKTRIKYCWA